MEISKNGVGGIACIARNCCQCAVRGFGTLVVHHLSHSSSDTSCDGTTLSEVVWTGIVVRATLIPIAGEEFLDGGMGTNRLARTLERGTCRVLLKGDDLVFVVLKPRFHVLGQLLIVEFAFRDIAQNLGCGIIARGYDIAFLLSDVEHIIWIRGIGCCPMVGSQACLIGNG